MIPIVGDLYSVNLPYANYGLVVRNNRISHAPPIARWMTGKPLVSVSNWVQKKGGTIIKIERN